MGTGRFVGAGWSRHSDGDVAAKESLNRRIKFGSGCSNEVGENIDVELLNDKHEDKIK